VQHLEEWGAEFSRHTKGQVGSRCPVHTATVAGLTVTLCEAQKQSLLEVADSPQLSQAMDAWAVGEMLARDVHYHWRANRSLIDDDLNRGHGSSRIGDSVRRYVSGGARDFV
jgi:hypothetical protein